MLFHCNTLDNKKWEIYSDVNWASVWKRSWSPDDDSLLGMWLWRFQALLFQLLTTSPCRAKCGFASPHRGTASEVTVWLLVGNSSSRAGEELQAGAFKPQKQKSPQGISKPHDLLYTWTSAVLNNCHGKALKSYFCTCLFGWQKELREPRGIWNYILHWKGNSVCVSFLRANILLSDQMVNSIGKSSFDGICICKQNFIFNLF